MEEGEEENPVHLEWGRNMAKQTGIITGGTATYMRGL